MALPSSSRCRVCASLSWPCAASSCVDAACRRAESGRTGVGAQQRGRTGVGAPGRQDTARLQADQPRGGQPRPRAATRRWRGRVRASLPSAWCPLRPWSLRQPAAPAPRGICGVRWTGPGGQGSDEAGLVDLDVSDSGPAGDSSRRAKGIPGRDKGGWRAGMRCEWIAGRNSHLQEGCTGLRCLDMWPRWGHPGGPTGAPPVCRGRPSNPLRGPCSAPGGRVGG